MVQVRLTLKLRPGRHEEMIDALRAIMLPARLERGCSRAQILQDVDAPESVVYVEDWPDPKDLEQRVGSRPFCQVLALMEAAAAPPAIEFRVITEIRGLEYVAAVRERQQTTPQ